MKGRCYPRYCYVIYYILSVFLLVFAIAPIFIRTNDSKYIIILWSVSMLIGSLICNIGALLNMQTYEIKDNEIIIRTVFGILTKLDLRQTVYEIVELDTYFSWATSVRKKWICLYENNGNKVDKFKYGCSNKRNDYKVQIIYSEDIIQKLKAINVEHV
ncbi:MAG: hypothetical protein ACI4U5_06115 [Bacilli bacterium]